EAASDATLEYLLSGPKSSLSEFLAALPCLLDAVHEAHGEPVRRRGKLVNHLREALVTAPQVRFAEALAETVRQSGEGRPLTFPAGRTFLDALDSACRWFLGQEFTPDFRKMMSRKFRANRRAFPDLGGGAGSRRRRSAKAFPALRRLVFRRLRVV